MKRLSLITLCALASLNTSTAFASETELQLDSPLKSSAAVQFKGQEAVQKVRPKKQVQFSEKKDVVYFTNVFVKAPDEEYIHGDKTPFFHSGKTQFEYSKSLKEERREDSIRVDLDYVLKWTERFHEARMKTKKEEFLDKAENERKYREEKEANAAKAGGHITYALERAKQTEENIKSLMVNVREFTGSSDRWPILNQPFWETVHALLLCRDDEETTLADREILQRRYIELNKMMAELYFKLTNETVGSFHHHYNRLLMVMPSLFHEEEFEFCFELLSKIKDTLPARRKTIHEHKEKLTAERLPEDPSTCICEGHMRQVDEQLQLLNWIKVAKSQSKDYREYIKSQFPAHIRQ